MNRLIHKISIFSTNFLQAFFVFGISVGLGAYLHSNIIEGVSVSMKTGIIAGLVVGIISCLGIILKYNTKFGLFLAGVCVTVFLTKYCIRSALIYGLASASLFYIALMFVNIRSIIRALR